MRTEISKARQTLLELFDVLVDRMAALEKNHDIQRSPILLIGAYPHGDLFPEESRREPLFGLNADRFRQRRRVQADERHRKAPPLAP